MHLRNNIGSIHHSNLAPWTTKKCVSNSSILSTINVNPSLRMIITYIIIKWIDIMIDVRKDDEHKYGLCISGRFSGSVVWDMRTIALS